MIYIIFVLRARINIEKILQKTQQRPKPQVENDEANKKDDKFVTSKKIDEEKDFEIDLTIFNNEQKELDDHMVFSDTCDKLCSIDDSFSDLCISLQRIIMAHNYYMLLDIQNNNDHQEIFIRFVNTVYKTNILNDYEHLTKHHRNNIYEINNIITKTSTLPSSHKPCKLKQCAATTRHYARDRKVDKMDEKENEPTQNIDEELLFYCNLFDSVHLYLIHAFEFGLRVIPHQYKDKVVIDDSKDNDEYEKKDIYLNHAFKAMTEDIKRKREISAQFSRFNTSNGKFSIGIDQTKSGMITSASDTHKQCEKKT